MIICTLYALATVITFMQMIMLINRGGKEQNIYQLLLYVMGCVCNIGYFALAISKTLEMAIICNSITYLGAVFLPLCVLMRTADLCGITLRRSTVSVLGWVYVMHNLPEMAQVIERGSWKEYRHG